MPKHQGGEMPKFHKAESPADVPKDDSELLDPADGGQKEQQGSEAVYDAIPSGPVGDMIEEIEKAPEGSIVFARGLVGKSDEHEARDLHETRYSAKSYLGRVEDWYHGHEDKKVKVVDARALVEHGAGSQGGAAMDAIKELASRPENAGYKIVVDWDPSLESAVFKPWHAFEGKVGDVGEWMERQKAHEPKDGDPSIEEVLAAYKEGMNKMFEWRGKLGRDLSALYDGDNLLDVLFVVYCQTGRIDAGAIDAVVSPAKRVEKKVFRVSFMADGQVEASVGQMYAATRRAA